ncbi:hypothetical protein AMJ71_09230 [candidate division TA06 bacterium SM1_40]|uniref:Uncharacterized protein n=2 Tax=Bacteria division TA06 TaxID=1156500 RepID=A0A0S8JCB1_UNCT6|nr:MAG: hypothetical protein AMJ82_00890 [candidate division TA06 bacterium SM23_40]KPL07327.1 MAG: hypothetical protein AMJ71_09230 [candidate division TA06 bacterium SM1_40]
MARIEISAPLARRIRRLARVSALLWNASAFLFALGVGLRDPALPIFLLLIIPIGGSGLAWRWEGIGGAVIMIGAFLLAAGGFSPAGRMKIIALFMIGVPYLIIGKLFLICWWLTRMLPES